jgi:hypothetical protein
MLRPRLDCTLTEERCDALFVRGCAAFLSPLLIFAAIRLRPIATRAQGPNARSLAHKPSSAEIFIALLQESVDSSISLMP